MSSYLHFYVKEKDGNYRYLFGYSRSSTIYNLFYDEDYVGTHSDKSLDRVAAPFTNKDITYLQGQLKDERLRLNERMNSARELIEFAKTSNCTMEERLELYHQQSEDIEYLNESLDDISYAMHFLIFLEDMCDNDFELFVGVDCAAPNGDYCND